jgi:hypothetical protein
MRNQRNAEFGMRNAELGEAIRSAFRIPHSAFVLFAPILLANCNPTTTRPDFHPLPMARSAQIFARPHQVIPALTSVVAAESLRVRHASIRDGYLETDWYDTRTRRSFRNDAAVPDLVHAVKLRCWADPYVPGQTILTVEVAYRRRYDPSRNGRDLELLVPEGRAGDSLATDVLEQLKRRFGSP